MKMRKIAEWIDRVLWWGFASAVLATFVYNLFTIHG